MSYNIYKKDTDTLDPISGRVADVQAEEVGYNNATSGLEATNVQDALDSVTEELLKQETSVLTSTLFDLDVNQTFCIKKGNLVQLKFSAKAKSNVSAWSTVLLFQNRNLLPDQYCTFIGWNATKNTPVGFQIDPKTETGNVATIGAISQNDTVRALFTYFA